MAPGPLSDLRLKQIATEACDDALKSVDGYVHTATIQWNSNIINCIIEEIIRETTSKDRPPRFKWAVNSTIIQHDVLGEGEMGTPRQRGMHSASGAFWNGETDGQWSFKYDGATKKGMEVVVSITWMMAF